MHRMSANIEDRLQSLLRGEIAAAETYNQVLEDRQDGEQPEQALRELQRDHGRAIRFLTDQLDKLGVEAPAQSGVWGQFARLVEGGAKMLGDKAALAALREGERRGLDDYSDAVQAGNLPPDCRAYIEHELLPAQRRHIEKLDRLMQSA